MIEQFDADKLGNLSQGVMVKVLLLFILQCLRTFGGKLLSGFVMVVQLVDRFHTVIVEQS